MGEHSITNAKASVMLYDNDRKQWQHSGGTPGLSRVNIYHHPVNNTFRIVGRKLDDHAVVINCALARGLKYNEATPTFHQWRDQRQVYGLNFQSSEDALRFGQEVRRALEMLKEASQQPPAQSYQQRDQYYQETVSNGPSHEDMIRQQQNADYDSHDNYSSRIRAPSSGGHYRQYDSQLSGGGSESESLNSSQLSVVSSQVSSGPPAAPAAPTPPPAPPAPPAAPAAPPAPPPAPGGGGPPAPPPPPPAPTGGGGGSLADQIAAAKLRKSSKNENGGNDGGMRTERSGSRSNNVGGPGGMDMMAEMQRKLAARRAKTEDKPVSNGPVKQEEERSFPVVRSMSQSSSPTPPPFSSNKSNFGNQPTKTSTTSISSSGSRFNSSRSDVTLSNDQLEEFKNELLSAFRQELENYKEDIIQAVRDELSKSL